MRLTKSPATLAAENQLVDAALSTLSDVPPGKLRMVIIPNTLHLHECLVSQVVAEEVRGKPGMDVENGPVELAFDAEHNLAC